VLFERLVRENAGGTDLDQVAAELAFERAFFIPAEIDIIMGCENVKVSASRIITIEPDTTVTLDAAVHLVIDKRAEVLVFVRAFIEARPAVIMAGHDRHVLKVAFSALVADRAVMGMVQHEPFDHAGPEGPRIGIVDGQAHSIDHRGHAGHGDPAPRVLVILEHFDSALTARADRVQGRVPAEVGKVESKGQAGPEEVLAFFNLMGLIVDVDRNHDISVVQTV
jgi:hypothetical protein